MGLSSQDDAGAAAAAAATPEPPTEASTETPTETPPAASTAPAAGAAPWDSAVAERFSDQAVRDQVSAFMREHTQPYVTKLEQDRADLAGKAAWYDDLTTKPADTLRDAIGELYDPETAAKVADLLTPKQQAELVAAADPADAPAPNPEQEELLEWARAQKKSADDEALLARYLEDAKPHMEANPDIPESAFHRYVATEGGIEEGIAAYREDYPAAKAAVEDPPPALPGGGSGTVPTAPAFTSLKDAASSVFEAARKA